MAIATSRLFVAKRDHGIDGGGAARWKVGGDERDSSENEDGSEHGRGVVGSEAEEHFLEEAHGGERNGEACGDTAGEHDHYIADHKAKDGGARSSEGHSNAEFGLTLANQKAERAVQANGCKKQSETAEECRERSEKAVFDQRSVNLLGEGVEFKGDAFVHLGDRLLDGGGESGGA